MVGLSDTDKKNMQAWADVSGEDLVGLAVTTWYIAGPMTGLPEWNYPAFNDAEAWLRERFPEDEIINPAREFDGDTTLPRETYMRRAFANVARADRVLLLRDWYNSDGACAEVIVAYAVGAEIWHRHQDGYDVGPCPLRDDDYEKALHVLAERWEAKL